MSRMRDYVVRCTQYVPVGTIAYVRATSKAKAIEGMQALAGQGYEFDGYEGEGGRTSMAAETVDGFPNDQEPVSAQDVEALS